MSSVKAPTSSRTVATERPPKGKSRAGYEPPPYASNGKPSALTRNNLVRDLYFPDEGYEHTEQASEVPAELMKILVNNYGNYDEESIWLGCRPSNPTRCVDSG